MNIKCTSDFFLFQIIAVKSDLSQMHHCHCWPSTRPCFLISGHSNIVWSQPDASLPSLAFDSALFSRFGSFNKAWVGGNGNGGNRGEKTRPESSKIIFRLWIFSIWFFSTVLISDLYSYTSNGRRLFRNKMINMLVRREGAAYKPRTTISNSQGAA